MILAPEPFNENERIKEVYRYDVLNTQAEEDYDQIVKLASEICQVPISTITLIDTHRQWHKAKTGVNSPEGERDISFCAYTILGDGMMQVPDAAKDERFHDNPLVVSDPNIRFYAGIPLVSSRGFNIGSLCVIDTVPRNLTDEQSFALQVLAKQVIKLFELRLRNREIEARNAIIESQKEHLAELSAIQNKIISIVAHDIRGPVASLKNIIELRKEDVISNHDIMEFMSTVDRQLDSTLYMLTNLVEWGAILLKRSEVNLKPVNLFDLLSGEMKVLEIAISSKANRIENKVPQDCVINTDENMLRFILRNLVGNANKFTDDGKIVVSVQQDADHVTISVADTGIGMSDEIRAGLFDASKRHSRRGTRQETGSGLGLILTREFAHALGITVTVNSEPGKGTEILLQVPTNN
jgi:signal transduction histidine kinase